ncbi:MAG TPA: hypothetical protein VFW28_06595 [Micropepsaceae bacterium]|nr:hypothetical protein [Micropepsaceae bacterium]
MQNILATWFVKISIVGDSARRGDWNVSKEHRRWMYDHKSPPPNWEVYIGYYTGETWRDLGIFQQGGYLDLTSIGGPGKLTGYAKLTSMGMGNLFAVTIGRQFDMRWDVRGPGATYLRQIWPASGDIQWPTVPVLGDREATAIAHMFPTLRIAKD